MATVNGSYLIARTLKEEGVDTLFYLMGGPNFDIVMSCQDLGIKTIDFRHEQAAAFAAHAYARASAFFAMRRPMCSASSTRRRMKDSARSRRAGSASTWASNSAAAITSITIAAMSFARSSA